MPPKSNHIPSHSPRPTQSPIVNISRFGTSITEEDVWGPYSVGGSNYYKCLVIVVRPKTAYKGVSDLFLIGIDDASDQLRFVCDIPKTSNNSRNSLYSMVQHITYNRKPNPKNISYNNWIITENTIHDFFDAVVQKYGK